MKQYLDLLSEIITSGYLAPNRTGVSAKVIHNRMIHFDLQVGFPILTTKFVSLKMVAVELEFFLRGLTSKAWLQERNCHIWDEWCAPSLLAEKTFSSKEEKLQFMKEQDDLGPIYGKQWRNFNGIDQIAQCIHKLKNDPTDRANIVSAWNVPELKDMALRPCHHMFQVNVRNGEYLDMLWNQRSCDVALGIPYNIASYALLTHLLAKESGLKPGVLSGALSNVHVYENHLDLASEQITRIPGELPQLEFTRWERIDNWHFDDVKLVNYKHQGKIPYEMTAI